MYSGFIMTSRDDEDDTISKENVALFPRGNVTQEIQRLTHDVKKNLFLLLLLLNMVSLW